MCVCVCVCVPCELWWFSAISFVVCRMLLHANANPALVNNEGETPLDMTSSEDEEILELLQNEIKKKGRVEGRRGAQRRGGEEG